MAGFNPNAPCAVGCEWFPSGQFYIGVADDIVDEATMDWVMDSTVAETIDALWVPAQATTARRSDAAKALRGGYEIEIYDAGDLGADTVTETVYVPTVDAALHPAPGVLGYSGSFSPSNIYATVDNTTLTPGLYDSTYTIQDQDFLSPLFGQAGNYSFRVGSSIGSAHVGEQVLGVRVEALCDQIVALGLTAGATIAPFLILNGVRYVGPSVTYSGPQPGGLLVAHTWTANPRTGVSWTVADLAAFSSGASTAAGVAIAKNGNANNLPIVYTLNLTVVARPEVRKAVGALVNPSPGWNRVAMTQPDGTDNWPKGEGIYLVTMRRKTGTGTFLIPAIIGDAVHQTQSVFTQFSPLTRQPTSWEYIVRPATAPLVLQTTTPTVSVDSQPYAAATDYYPALQFDGRTGEYWPALGVKNQWCAVDVSQTVAQELTIAANGDYSWVRFMAALSPFAFAGDEATSVLYVRLRNAGGTLLDQLEFTWDDLEEALRDTSGNRDGASSFALLEGQFNTQTLTSGSQVTVEFASVAAFNTGWRLMMLSTLDESISGGPPAGTEGATRGGTTDTIRVNGASSAYDHADYAVTLHQVVDTPTGLAAAWDELDCVGVVSLSWDAFPADTCGIAAEWHIDRRENGGAWLPIARILDGDVDEFDDYEAVRNGTVEYRLRVRRADGAVSPWTAAVSVVTSTACCGYTFTSNQAPELTVWYDDLAPREYNFVDNRVGVELQGRDGSVVFAELEDRLESITVTLLVAADGGKGGTELAATPGRREFDPLLVLAGNKRDPDTGTMYRLPYVAVLDNDGNRWLASVKVERGVRDETRGSAYELQVTITEVTQRPAPFVGVPGDGS